MATLDILTIAQDYGLFVALVAFIIYDNRQREARYRERENTFIEETRDREQKYMEREEKYIAVIERLSASYEKMQKDVSFIKKRLGDAK
jgi:hypothetical protein